MAKAKSHEAVILKALFMLYIPLFFAFFRIFTDFHVNKVCVSEAHLPNRYLLLCSFPEIITQYISKAKSNKAGSLKALFLL